MGDNRFIFGKTPFFFVRHGHTPQSELGILQGQTDTELNSNGLSAAERSAHALQSVGLKSIYASPLKRAWRTATIIKTLTGTSLYPLPGLMERHWGIYQGRSKSVRPNEVNPDTVESLENFTDRVLTAMASITGPSPVLIVAHSGVFRVLCRHAGLSSSREISISNEEPIKFESPTTDRSSWHISML